MKPFGAQMKKYRLYLQSNSFNNRQERTQIFEFFFEFWSQTEDSQTSGFDFSSSGIMNRLVLDTVLLRFFNDSRNRYPIATCKDYS